MTDIDMFLKSKECKLNCDAERPSQVLHKLLLFLTLCCAIQIHLSLESY